MSRFVDAVDYRVRRAVRFPALVTTGCIVATLLGIYGSWERLLPPTLALALIIVGPVVAFSLLRPAWVVLLILVAPPGLLAGVPNALLVVLVAVPLLAMGLRDWSIDLRARSGVVPLVALFILAVAHPTSELGPGLDFADGLLKLMAYYAGALLLAYNAVRRHDLSIHDVTTALLAGAVLNAGLEFALSGSPGQGGATLWTYGRNYGNIAVMGLGVVIVRLLRPDDVHGLRGHRAWNLAMGSLFLALAGLTLLRAAWLAIAVIAVIAVWQAGLARWLVMVPLIAMLVLVVPVARERVVPTELAGNEIDLTDYTTGRWRLWTIAASEVEPGAPAGRGWGTWWSMSPEELFDSGIAFVTRDDQEFVFLHNDFLLLLVDLGVVGAALFVAFWGHLLTVFRRILSGPGPSRIAVLALVGVPVMFLITTLVSNGLEIRGVAERFFVVVGAVFGVAALDRETTDHEATDVVRVHEPGVPV